MYRLAPAAASADPDLAPCARLEAVAQQVLVLVEAREHNGDSLDQLLLGAREIADADLLADPFEERIPQRVLSGEVPVKRALGDLRRARHRGMRQVLGALAGDHV